MDPNTAYLNQRHATLALGLCGALLMFAMAFPTFCLGGMMADIMRPEATALAAVVPYAGLAGNGAAGLALGRLGRVQTMRLGTVLYLAGHLAMLLASAHLQATFLLLCRGLVGFSVSFLFVGSIVYGPEITSPEHRDIFNAIQGLMVNAGNLLALVAGMFLSWRQVVVVGGALTVLLLGLLSTLPETPYWLHRAGRKGEARISLEHFRSSGAEVEKELEALEKHSDQASVSVRDLFTRPYVTPSLAVLLMFIAQQATGFVGIATNSNDIFDKIGSHIDPGTLTISVAIFNSSLMFVVAFIHERLNRKTTLLIFTTAQSVMLMCIGFYFSKLNTDSQLPSSYLGFTLIVLYNAAHSIGIGVLPFLYMNEGLPNKIRGVASPILVTVNGLMSGIVIQTFDPLVESFGYSGTFNIFGVLTLIFSLGSYYMSVETKGLSMSDIDELYEQRSGSDKKKDKKVN